jgi:hypothetical protein
MATSLMSREVSTKVKAGRIWPKYSPGNVKADVLEKLLPGYVRPNFCAMIAISPFPD